MDIDAATDLYASFKKQANRSPNKPISQLILDSRLILAKGRSLNLGQLSKRKLLSCAPFENTCVVFIGEPIYKNQPFSQAAGFKLGALLYNESEKEMHLFAQTRTGQIALVPKEMMKGLSEGLLNWLTPIFAHINTGNPTKRWWGKQQHYYVRDHDEVPPDFYVPGMFRTSQAVPEGKELVQWARDTRASIKLRVHRGRGEPSQARQELLEKHDYQYWASNEAMDPQPENLLLKRGHKPKGAGEWLAAKMWRSASFVHGAESHEYIPSVRISEV
ncbi:MAG: hypothetical protein O7B23_10820 [Deltaproteobacteria bacterium]|nr:hypothetical protein [Deltaproteobacteria bacterium]